MDLLDQIRSWSLELEATGVWEFRGARLLDGRILIPIWPIFVQPALRVLTKVLSWIKRALINSIIGSLGWLICRSMAWLVTWSMRILYWMLWWGELSITQESIDRILHAGSGFLFHSSILQLHLLLQFELLYIESNLVIKVIRHLYLLLCKLLTPLQQVKFDIIQLRISIKLPVPQMLVHSLRQEALERLGYPLILL